jgi:hypothetical protein
VKLTEADEKETTKKDNCQDEKPQEISAMKHEAFLNLSHNK